MKILFALLGLKIYFKASDPFNEKWQGAWIITAFWDIVAFALLCVICYLWAPSQSSQRYAYAGEKGEEIEDEERESLFKESSQGDISLVNQERKDGSDSSDLEDEREEEGVLALALLCHLTFAGSAANEDEEEKAAWILALGGGDMATAEAKDDVDLQQELASSYNNNHNNFYNLSKGESRRILHGHHHNKCCRPDYCSTCCTPCPKCCEYGRRK
ncbi:hypothetical protein M9H77_20822 [Catharanthus roseus]|uniref:Uncharacterized protein n=1 Tax=Catharanthus roseus TaxID=4058 RepID=A0ACC0AMV6_CATRO|nr:hypothetical protein M9H77_20822 [Catharanthus roseus]